ncbi:hypothetical protein ACHAWF_003740 [Thalassiosira exigua]
MAYGVSRGPPVDEADLASFAETLSSLPTEEWRRRVAALRTLVDSVPDYATTPPDDDGRPRNDDDVARTPSSSRDGGVVVGSALGNPHHKTVPWYRSSKSVRRLAPPLKSLLLDARSAVAKEATELIGTLLMVKLQPHPSLTTVDGGGGGDKSEAGGEGGGNEDSGKERNGGLETIDGGLAAGKVVRRPPPPPFVGRLLLKDLLPWILDLSKQTVKAIRTYGVSMMVDVLPHCRVKSCAVVLLERTKAHPNRTVREDCARYLRCVLETWPSESGGSNGDAASSEKVVVVNSRKEERLSSDLTRQIGLGLGRALSDAAKPVREEAKRGFRVLFVRFRPVWDEVMTSGVVRDVRLRKRLLEAAGRSDGNGAALFDDAASLGELSLNSAASGMSYATQRSTASHRSFASHRGGAATNGVPSTIGTPKTQPRTRYAPSSGSSPSYMRGTGSSTARNAEQPRMPHNESSKAYSANQYVTSSGHVMSTPSPRSRGRYARGEAAVTPQQPFASLLQTPGRREAHLRSPEPREHQSREDLKKRLSRRISGINAHVPDHAHSPGQLCSIQEGENDKGGISLLPSQDVLPSSEIATLAMEVVTAHLTHMERIEASIAKERELLTDLNNSWT